MSDSDARADSRSVRAVLSEVLGPWFLVVCALFLGVVYLVVIFANSYEVLVRDDWPRHVVYFKSGLWEILTHKHNGHPGFIPNLFHMASFHIFDDRMKLQVVTNLTALMLTGVVLASAIIRDASSAERYVPAKTLTIVTLSVALLWMEQYRTILWAIGIENGLTCLGAAVSAVGCVQWFSEGWRLGSGASIKTFAGAFLASLSFGYGVSVWPMLAIGAALGRAPPRIYLTILLGTVVAWTIINVGLDGESTPIRLTLSGIKDVAIGLPAYLGAPFIDIGYPDPTSAVWEFYAASTIGGSALALAANEGCSQWTENGLGHDRKSSAARIGPGACLLVIVFVIGGGVLVLLARAGEYGVQATAFAPRFGSWRVLFWAGVVGLLLTKSIGPSGLFVRPLFHSLVCAMVLAYLTIDLVGKSDYAEAAHARRELASTALMVSPRHHKSFLTATLFKSWPTVSYVNSRLNAAGLNIYSLRWRDYLYRRIADLKVVDGDRECIGQWNVRKYSPKQESVLLEGWIAGLVVDPDAIVFGQDGTVVGLGRPAKTSVSRSLSMQDDLQTERGWWRLAEGIFGGWETGWVGTAEVSGNAVRNVGIDVYAVRDGKRLCEMKSAALREIVPGETIEFGKDEGAMPVILDGFARPDGRGVWTRGKRSAVVLNGLSKDEGVTAFTVVGRPLVAGGRPIKITVLVNGNSVAAREFGDADGSVQNWTVEVSESIWNEAGVQEIAFVTEAPRSPAALGLSADGRKLGFHVQRVTLGEMDREGK